jgi:small-conductance mechanosensitive channel
MSIFEDFATYLRDHAPELLARAGVALLIAVGSYVIARILARFAAAVVGRRKKRGHRAKTLEPIIRTVVFLFAFGAGIVSALDHLGIDVAAVLAGAGIVGLAIGFGAQTLVKDCLSGFFLILDDVIAQGDTVEIEGVTGTVERVGLRVTRVRPFNGELWYIPNGSITKVGNWTRTWARAIVDVTISSKEDVRRALDVLREVADEWAKENDDVALEPPEVQGALGFNAVDVNLRLAVKIKADEHRVGKIERELRMRIKRAFDDAAILYGAPAPATAPPRAQEPKPVEVADKTDEAVEPAPPSEPPDASVKRGPDARESATDGHRRGP